MPTLRFHGVSHEKIIAAAPQIFDQLTKIYEIPDDYLNIEVVNSLWIGRDGVKEGFPMVEILAFRRDVEIEDMVTSVLDQILKSVGCHESEQYFIHLEPRSYYSGGEHF